MDVFFLSSQKENLHFIANLNLYSFRFYSGAVLPYIFSRLALLVLAILIYGTPTKIWSIAQAGFGNFKFIRWTSLPFADVH